MAEPTVHDLPAEADALQAVELRRDSIGDGDVLEPHRHAYHELIWVHDGHGRHLIDGEPVEFGPRTLTLIPKGQVHQFKEAEGVSGLVVRFDDEWLTGVAPLALLAAGRAPRSAFRRTTRPASRRCSTSCARRSSARPGRSPPSCAATCSPRCCSGRSAGARRSSRAAAPPARTWSCTASSRSCSSATSRRATRRGHYAAELGTTTGTLSRVLTRLTGRSTKQLIMDRVILEAVRLLRFSDLSIKEIAARLGFSGPVRVLEGLQAAARGGPARLPRARAARSLPV